MTETHTESFSGSCLCGSVSFHFNAPTLWCAHCHCTQCRRAHGSAFVTWVGVRNDRFTLSKGESLHWYRSSREGERGFCNECGSTIFFRSSRWPGETHIARANITGDLDREPSGHVSFGAGEVPWFPFKDALPHTDTSDS